MAWAMAVSLGVDGLGWELSCKVLTVTVHTAARAGVEGEGFVHNQATRPRHRTAAVNADNLAGC